jgi:hypothetical protein
MTWIINMADPMIFPCFAGINQPNPMADGSPNPKMRRFRSLAGAN